MEEVATRKCNSVQPGWVKRRHDNIGSDYAASLDAILCPAQMWPWFKPGKAEKLAYPHIGIIELAGASWRAGTVWD